MFRTKRCLYLVLPDLWWSSYVNITIIIWQEWQTGISYLISLSPLHLKNIAYVIIGKASKTPVTNNFCGGASLSYGICPWLGFWSHSLSTPCWLNLSIPKEVFDSIEPDGASVGQRWEVLHTSPRWGGFTRRRAIILTPGGESSPGLSMVSNPRAGELRALVVPLEKVIIIRIALYFALEGCERPCWNSKGVDFGKTC